MDFNKIKLAVAGLLVGANMYAQEADTTKFTSNFEQMNTTEESFDKVNDENYPALVDSVQSYLDGHCIDPERLAFLRVNSHYNVETNELSDTIQAYYGLLVPWKVDPTLAETYAGVTQDVVSRTATSEHFNLLPSKKNNLNDLELSQKKAKEIYFDEVDMCKVNGNLDWEIYDARPVRVNGEGHYLVYVGFSNLAGHVRPRLPVNDPLDHPYFETPLDSAEENMTQEFVYWRNDDSSEEQTNQERKTGLLIGGLASYTPNAEAWSGMGLIGYRGKNIVPALIVGSTNYNNTTLESEVVERVPLPMNGEYTVTENTQITESSGIKLGAYLGFPIGNNLVLGPYANFTQITSDSFLEGVGRTQFQIPNGPVTQEIEYTDANLERRIGLSDVGGLLLIGKGNFQGAVGVGYDALNNGVNISAGATYTLPFK